MVDLGVTIRVTRLLEPVHDLADSSESMCHKINEMADNVFPRPISYTLSLAAICTEHRRRKYTCSVHRPRSLRAQVVGGGRVADR
jgi:hypothetical protein